MPSAVLERAGGKPENGAGRNHKQASKDILAACKLKVPPSTIDTLASLRDVERETSCFFRRDALQALYYITRIFPESDLLGELVHAGALETLVELLAKDDHKYRVWGLLLFVNLLHSDAKPHEKRIRVAHRIGGLDCLLNSWKFELNGDESHDEKLGVFQHGAVAISALLAVDDFELCIGQATGHSLHSTLTEIVKVIDDKDYTDYVAPLLEKLHDAGFTKAPAPNNHTEKWLAEDEQTLTFNAEILKMTNTKGDTPTKSNVLHLVDIFFKCQHSVPILKSGLEACISGLKNDKFTDMFKTTLAEGGVFSSLVLTLHNQTAADAKGDSEVKALVVTLMSMMVQGNAINCRELVKARAGADASAAFAASMTAYMKGLLTTDVVAADAMVPVMQLFTELCKNLHLASLMGIEEAEGIRKGIYEVMEFALRDSSDAGFAVLGLIAEQYAQYGVAPWYFTADELAAKQEKDAAAHEVVAKAYSDAYAAKKEADAAKKKRAAEKEAEAAKVAQAEKEKAATAPADASAPSTATTAKTAEEDEDEAEEEEDEFPAADAAPEVPVGGTWKIRKCSRAGGMLARNQDRLLVLDGNNLSYYTMDALSATPTVSPYVKVGSTPKGQLRKTSDGGLIGCRSEMWHAQFDDKGGAGKPKRRASAIGGNDELTVQLHVPNDHVDDSNLIVQFENAAKVANFVAKFEAHAKYYATKK
jgi:hypothetical protein